MDRYDKWEMHNNHYYMPFYAESAGTSHFRFGAPCDVGFEHGFAGRSGTSTTADCYVAPEEFVSYDGDGCQQPGNTCPIDASEFDEDNDSDKVNKPI